MAFCEAFTSWEAETVPFCAFFALFSTRQDATQMEKSGT